MKQTLSLTGPEAFMKVQIIHYDFSYLPEIWSNGLDRSACMPQP